MGRPSKLSPEIAAVIADTVSAGCTIDSSVKAAGVSPASYFSWLARGAKARKRKDIMEDAGVEWDYEDRIYLEFLDKITCAKAKSEAALVAKIHEAGKDDWRAYAFLLERRFPNQWGKRERLDVNLFELSVRLAVQSGMTTGDMQQIVNNGPTKQKPQLADPRDGPIIDAIDSDDRPDGEGA